MLHVPALHEICREIAAVSSYFHRLFREHQQVVSPDVLELYLARSCEADWSAYCELRFALGIYRSIPVLAESKMSDNPLLWWVRFCSRRFCIPCGRLRTQGKLFSL